MTSQAPADAQAQLVRIGAALSSERDLAKLCEMILLGAKALTRADGGTLYLLRDEAELHFEMMHTTSLGIAAGGTTGNPITLAPIRLRGDGHETAIAAYAASARTSVNVADAYEAAGFDFEGARAFDQATGYRTRSVLCVPLLTHKGECIGVLQLINASDETTGEVRAFSTQAQALAEALASQAAVAIENRRLIDQLGELFEALISLINQAIDEKSPYTGGHCQRVPELTLMLADAAAAETSGPLAEFRMSEDDRYELRIAGLLHDCGKITTPVHVVDKATKLETISDRIAMVDTRFEVLRRDVRIAELEGGMTPAEATARLEEIASAQAFLRKANVGGEFMMDADIARVQEIAAWTWNPTGEGEVPLLTEEEVENLTIRAGTLTGAERKIINDHIVSTIAMLEALPWPKHLRNVPEFAGGHHERMDGKGYPRGLTREQMSVQARAMAIADIFEALTAADRPYKKAKPLSEALEIMEKFRSGGHIDPDLYDVFLRSQIHVRYAQRFLLPEQLDVPVGGEARS